MVYSVLHSRYDYALQRATQSTASGCADLVQDLEIYFLVSQPESCCLTAQYCLLDVASMKWCKFVELFRFERDDICELLMRLEIPDDVISAQCVGV